MTTRPRTYLAGRYSRREELCQYRTALQERGFPVHARWLDGMHQLDAAGVPIGDNGEALVETIPRGASGELMDPVGNPDEDRAAALREKFATDDYEDAYHADLMVCFTEEPRLPSTNRGGRHVEMGIGLAAGASVVVVGPRENIFSWLPRVLWFPTWDDFLAWVDTVSAVAS